MRTLAFAILTLGTWTQAPAEDRPAADPPGREMKIIVGRGTLGNRPIQELRLIFPETPVEDGGRRFVRPLRLDSAIIKSENFDLYLFGEETSRQRWEHLEALLAPRLQAAVERHHLNDRQTRKLMLAGRGDIKRFFDRVEDRRQEFEKTRRSFQAGYKTLVRLVDISKIYEEGPFGEGSLFAKTLRKIETDGGGEAKKPDQSL